MRELAQTTKRIVYTQDTVFYSNMDEIVALCGFNAAFFKALQ